MNLWKLANQEMIKDYATATVLMFRYFGIPARYVEGYLITQDDVKDADDNSTINIPKNNFHCWAEYYQDGVGWLPFETTPSYLDIMNKAEDYQNISGVSGGSSQDEQDMEQQEDEKQEEEEPDEKLFDLHREQFPGEDRLLFLYDSEENASVFLTENTGIRKQSGYYIYYEKKRADAELYGKRK